MNRYFKKGTAYLLSISLILSCSLFISGAETVSSSAGVTSDMCKASYWYDYSVGECDKVLMTTEEIDAWNKKTQDASGTSTCNIATTFAENYNANTQRESLSAKSNATSFRTDHDTIYVNGETYDKIEYLNGILDQIYETAYTSESQKTEYAVGIKRAAILSFPMNYEMGWSSTDCDDENQIGSIDVNEPVIIRQHAVIDGSDFYYCRSDNLGGWIKGSDIAICKDKNEWLEAWQVDSSSKDFLVVTQNKILLDKSHMDTDISEVKLTLGTILKLVPDEEKSSVGERGLWHNYVVYLPTRDNEGKYVRKTALISQHYSVSIGYLPYTQKNFLDLAFSCLGDRYGWGGTDDAMDCSQYTRTVFKCMGFQLPRNTTYQLNSPGSVISLSGKDNDFKSKLLKTCSLGASLYFTDKAHVMMYTGTVDNTGYCISNTATLYDTDSKYYQQYNVILNPLTVKRANGNSWLYNLGYILIPEGKIQISKADITVIDGVVSAKYEGTKLYEDVNYTVTEEDGKTIIEGINNFAGKATLSVKSIDKITFSSKSFYYDGKTHAPKVTVYAGNSKYSEDSSNVKITKEKGKLPGKYTVTAKGINLLKGSLSKTYQIKIKPANITKAAGNTNNIKFTLSKPGSKYITGYQIKLSTSSKMTNCKTVAGTSYIITAKNLKSGKKYYYKARTYKTIDGKKYYSDWSDILSVKTK